MSKGKPETVKLTVSTRRGVASFRRCGIEFTRDPLAIEVSPQDAERIRGEGRLVEMKPKADPKPKTEDKKATK